MLEDPEGSLARPLVKPLEEFGAWDRGAGSEPGLEDDEVSIGGPAAEFQIRWKAWEGRRHVPLTYLKKSSRGLTFSSNPVLSIPLAVA